MVTAGILIHSPTEPHPPIVNLGLKQILEKLDLCNKVVRTKFREAVDMVRATDVSNNITTVEGSAITTQRRNTQPMDEFLLKVVSKYGEKVLLGESDTTAKTTKRKGKRRSSVGFKQGQYFDDWKGPAPWDLSLGGDGHPKFLCDVMVSSLICLYCSCSDALSLSFFFFSMNDARCQLAREKNKPFA